MCENAMLPWKHAEGGREQWKTRVEHSPEVVGISVRICLGSGVVTCLEQF